MEKCNIKHSWTYNELRDKAVAELRSIIRGLKKIAPEQENLVYVSGTDIVKLSKDNSVNLIMGELHPIPIPQGNNEGDVDLADYIDATQDSPKEEPKKEKAHRKHVDAPDLSGGLGGLESYFIQLIKQHASPDIDENKISSLIASKIKPVVDQLKKGITARIELRKYDGKDIKLDLCHKDTEKAIHILSTREDNKRINLFLSGGAGSGKTHGAKLIAHALGVPFYPVSVGGQTTEAKLIGFTSPIDGEYKLTPLGHAIKFGGLWLGDEIDAGNSNVLTVLNALLSNECIMLGNELVNIHPDFYCIVAGNTTGYGANRIYVGRNPLDGAFLDRFCFMNWDYDEALEIKLSNNMDWAMRVQKIRRAVDDLKMQFIVSPRASITGAMLLAKTNGNDLPVFNQSEVEDLTIFNKIGAENKNKILSKMGES